MFWVQSGWSQDEVEQQRETQHQVSNQPVAPEVCLPARVLAEVGILRSGNESAQDRGGSECSYQQVRRTETGVVPKDRETDQGQQQGGRPEQQPCPKQFFLLAQTAAQYACDCQDRQQCQGKLSVIDRKCFSLLGCQDRKIIKTNRRQDQRQCGKDIAVFEPTQDGPCRDFAHTAGFPPLTVSVQLYGSIALKALRFYPKRA